MRMGVGASGDDHCLCSARPPLKVKEHGGGAAGVTDLTFVCKLVVCVCVCVCWLGFIRGKKKGRGRFGQKGGNDDFHTLLYELT